MKITIEIDEDDYRDLQREIAFRQRIKRPLPDGESDKVGAAIGEIVRDMWEYRGLSARLADSTGVECEWPEGTPGVNDGWGFSLEIDE